MLRSLISVLLSLFFFLQPSTAHCAPMRIKSISPTHSAAGADITIRGANFGSNKGRVLFGTVRATVLVWSPSRIKARAPVNSGRVPITLKQGKRSSNSITFRYDPALGYTSVKILAYNDLGMHCVDKDFSVFSILPPFNVVDAQVIAQSKSGVPKLLTGDAVSLRYDAVADPSGSINSTSMGKSNFWQYVEQIYEASLAEGVGLTGLRMPADATTLAQHALTWDPASHWYTARGIPIFPLDDSAAVNRYPLLRISAKDSTSGSNLGSIDIVLPVSEETTCQTCHNNGDPGARRSGIAFVTRSDKEIESRENILLLHDARNGTSLYASRPVLCAACHYSPALDLSGSGPNETQLPHATLSAVMHMHHADKMIDAQGVAFWDSSVERGATPPSAERQACYQCHPGASTKCLRGAMSQSLSCQNCHGDMSAVGGALPLLSGGSIDGNNDGAPRRPWLDLPRCQSCHTGDAYEHLSAGSAVLANDGFRLIKAFASDDSSASPRLAKHSRFAEQPATLFRNSRGHGGIACEGCHGSTHAIWPNADPNANDNITASELQGHSGVLMECTACHRAGTLSANLDGPHGMHPVADANWIGHHEEQYKRHASDCKACHGLDLRGTSLSAASMDRTLRVGELGTRTFRKREVIGCYSCHNGPGGD